MGYPKLSIQYIQPTINHTGRATIPIGTEYILAYMGGKFNVDDVKPLVGRPTFTQGIMGNN